MTGIPDHDRELGMAEITHLLGVSDDTVKRRIHAGLLRARVEGRYYRVLRSEVERYLRETHYKPRQKP